MKMVDVQDKTKVLIMAMYADGECVPVRWKFSGLTGYRYDEPPVEVIIMSSGPFSEDAIADRCEAYTGVRPLLIEASKEKYPEYYL